MSWSLPKLVCAGGLVALVVGCAAWTSGLGDPSQLPPPKAARDSVTLEIHFVSVAPGAEAQLAEVWEQIDEQHLPTELRRQLAANGLRAGLVGRTLPAALRELIEQSPAGALTGEAAVGTGVAPGGGAARPFRQLTCMPGHRAEIIASDVMNEMHLLCREEGQVCGQTLQQAQCLWAVKTYPLGDGRVRLQLTPEVQHGQPQSQWVGQDGMFRRVMGREKKVFETLRIETALAPGQTLLLAAAPEIAGLGAHYFGKPANRGDVAQRLLLIRVAQVRHDDRFAPDAPSSPAPGAAEDIFTL